MVREAMQAMTSDNASYATKYQKVRIRVDPEYREKVNQYHREYLRDRYETDPEYRDRKLQAARQRQQNILSDPDRRAEHNAKRRQRYASSKRAQLSA